MNRPVNAYRVLMIGSALSASTLRMVAAAGVAAVLGGAMGLAHAGGRAREATELAEQQTLQVQEASRLFLDWLSVDSGDKRLDSLTLRRIALLEAARARRSEGLAGLALVLGILLLVAAHLTSSIKSGVVRLQDTGIDKGFEINRRPARRSLPQRWSVPTPGYSRDTVTRT